MNSLYQQMIQSQKQNHLLPNNLSQLMAQFKSFNNPQTALEVMSKQNPELANVMSIIKQYGGDPQRAFYQKAQEMGIDTNGIINALKGFIK